MSRAPARIGRYEPITLLATGGMGRIYLARTRGLGGFERHVVIKTLELADDEVDAEEHDVKAMFVDEARVLGVLHHQHIAPVFEIGDHEGQLYLVLDYVHGYNAHNVWERARELGAALPLDFTLTVVAASAAGLHYAHTRRGPDGKPLQIVHRDVSPANIMVGFDGAVKLIDFGIAKSANRTQKTQAGFVKGKIGYMAPEQVRGGAIDARTDVFCLGTVLYELTTMRRAFREQSDRMTMERIKSAAFVPPSQLIPDYPKELEKVVARALRVDPRERFPDAEALRKAVEALGHRYELVLGDAAIAEIMTQLFDDADRREPWQREESQPETALEVPLEVDRPEADEPKGAPAFKKKFRSATEAVDALGPDPEPGLDTIAGGDATLDALVPEMTTPQANRFATESETKVGGPSYPDVQPASAVEPPAGERVSKIERLFTQSSFDPTETPQRPIELAAEPRPAPADPIPARRSTQRGVGIDTDGVEIVPPQRAAVGIDTDGIEILPPQQPAATFTAGKAPAPAKAPSSSTKRIALIAIITIAAGVIAFVIYALASGGATPVADVEPDARIVHAPPPTIDAAAAAIDAEPITSAADATADSRPADAAADSRTTLDAASVDATRAVVDAAVSDAAPRDASVVAKVDAGAEKHNVHLKVTSTPDGATVELDGNRLGKTPFEGAVDVTAGKHVLKLRRSGYTPIKTEIELASDYEHEFSMTKTKTDKEREKEQPTPDEPKGGLDL